MDTTITFSAFDWAILAIYLSFIVWIGYYLKQFTKSDEDFFLAGRRNSMWVCGIAFMSANMGAMEVIGYAGQSVKYGLFTAHFYLIGAIPAILFLGVFMMPFYYNSKIKSIPGYLNERFNGQTRLLNAIMFAVNMILVSGIALYLLGLVLHTFIGWSWHLSIWVAALLVGAYITMSGLLSAMFTEIIQFFLIWASILLLPVFGFVDIGGPAQIGAHLSDAMTSLWSTTGNPAANPMHITWVGLILGLGFAVGYGYWTTDFLIIQRAFSAKDLRSARMAPIIASYFKLILGFVVISAGMVALVLLKDPGSGFHLLTQANGSPNYDSVMPLLMQRYFPPGLIGIGVTALVAMFMAGTAGNMSAFNTVFTYDIYQSFINKEATQSRLLWVGRVSTVAGIFLAIIGAYVAKSMPTAIGYLQAIASMFLAPSVAVILLGMFSKRITPKGGFWGLLTGVLFSIVFFVLQDAGILTTTALVPGQSNGTASFMAANFWRAWWAWLVSAGVAVGVSFVTEGQSQQELEGYVKGTVTEEIPSEKHLPWYQRTVFWASVTLVIFIVINIYFW